LLKHFWEKMAVFKIKLMSYWHSSGEFVKVCTDDESDGDNEKNASDDSDASDEDME
ncbi:hypothetical protein LPJ71_005757, partial [Coemansia sp. S17]